MIAWPRNIWKYTLVCEMISWESLILRDLSEERLQLKEKNDLASTYHELTLETKKSIKLTWEIYENIGITQAREWLSTTSMTGTKTLFIDNIERLTLQSINSLLKTLEEPYPMTRIIATTSAIDRVLPTIASRAMILRAVPPLVSHDDRRIMFWSCGRIGRIMRLENIDMLMFEQILWSDLHDVRAGLMRCHEHGMLSWVRDALSSAYPSLVPLCHELQTKISANLKDETVLTYGAYMLRSSLSSIQDGADYTKYR